jgi:hypothetical protein
MHLFTAHAQETIPATGGSAAGTGGSGTYTVGQIAWKVIPGTDGSVIQGVQQPYEISTVTAIEETDDITLEYYVYPNPAQGEIRLVIGSSAHNDLSYKMYDLNGKIISHKPVTDSQTEISLDGLPAAIYFLHVVRDKSEIKVFKIIKR